MDVKRTKPLFMKLFSMRLYSATVCIYRSLAMLELCLYSHSLCNLKSLLYPLESNKTPCTQGTEHAFHGCPFADDCSLDIS